MPLQRRNYAVVIPLLFSCYPLLVPLLTVNELSQFGFVTMTRRVLEFLLGTDIPQAQYSKFKSTVWTLLLSGWLAYVDIGESCFFRCMVVLLGCFSKPDLQVYTVVLCSNFSELRTADDCFELLQFLFPRCSDHQISCEGGWASSWLTCSFWIDCSSNAVKNCFF